MHRFALLERRLLALVLLSLKILVCRHGESENNRPKDHQAEPPMLAAPIDPTCLIRPRRRIRGFSAVLLPFAGDGTIDWIGFRAPTCCGPRRRA